MYADPTDLFLHDVILRSARQFSERAALIDVSADRHLTYAQYGERVEQVAKGFVGAGLKPNDRVGIFLPNSWEFAVAFHAAMLAGAIPAPLNPSYREREVRYQLENSGAAMLVSDGTLIANMNLGGLPELRRVYTTRTPASGADAFGELMRRGKSARLPESSTSPQETVAALPYSSGTTGLPKGVMLSHYNLVANIFQTLAPEDEATTGFTSGTCLCFLPLYHIYGLNVILDVILAAGATLVLMPRFDCAAALDAIAKYRPTVIPLVPPIVNAFTQAAERGLFPRDHGVSWVKSGAAPLAPELASRFTELTGIPIRQGYGMTEASPVTHLGFTEPGLYNPASIGMPVAETNCRVLDLNDNDAAPGEAGELVMRGPQFMLGYWHAPEATASVLRDGWYWSGDVVKRDERGFYYVLDRRKEMIKYKGFPVAPAEIESVLLEHPAVRDCGVVGRKCEDTEIPVAFITLRDGFAESDKLRSELLDFVGQQLTPYKQPREMHFVPHIPHTPSGKILRRELRQLLGTETTTTSGT
jgi:acyl-CoA synthetase (AMP-forming)/AMP-acid ligase II